MFSKYNLDTCYGPVRYSCVCGTRAAFIDFCLYLLLVLCCLKCLCSIKSYVSSDIKGRLFEVGCGCVSLTASINALFVTDHNSAAVELYIFSNMEEEDMLSTHC